LLTSIYNDLYYCKNQKARKENEEVRKKAEKEKEKDNASKQVSMITMNEFMNFYIIFGYLF